MTHILVYGDSTTYGAWDSKGGWVDRLRGRFFKGNTAGKKYLLVYNLGISGGTTNLIVKRFDNETAIRLDDDPGNDTIFIFSGGGNDAMWIPSKKKNQVPLPRFKKNIHTLIKKARKYSSKMVFLGIKPCDETKTTPIPWHPIGSYRMSHFAKYNEALKRICEEEKVPFINAFSKFNNRKFISTLEDGIHPLDKGHAMMEKIVWNFLKKKKWV